MAKRSTGKPAGKKAEKEKASSLKLAQLTANFLSIHRRDIPNVIEKGEVLLEMRRHLKRDRDWTAHLTDILDLPPRTAHNYCNAAEYAIRIANSATIAELSHIAPGVLYDLASGNVPQEVEAEILKRAKAGTLIDQGRAKTIRDEYDEKLEREEREREEREELERQERERKQRPSVPEPDEKADESTTVEPADKPADHGGTDGEPSEDAETKDILDGPPPQPPVAPPAATSPSLPATAPPSPVGPRQRDAALVDFDATVIRLNQLVSKPLSVFEGTKLDADTLTRVAELLTAVANKKPPRPPSPTPPPPPETPPSSSLDVGDQPWSARNPAAEAAKREIEQEQADLKKRKARGRVAKMKAKQSGAIKSTELPHE